MDGMQGMETMQWVMQEMHSCEPLPAAGSAGSAGNASQCQLTDAASLALLTLQAAASQKCLLTPFAGRDGQPLYSRHRQHPGPAARLTAVEWLLQLPISKP